MRAEHDDGLKLGRYVLERRIASGGMADVYLARQVGPFGFAKEVAVKVLKATVADDTDTVRMFLREALVAADFKHPNLAQVYEVGSENGKLYLAMELVRGVSVATLMHLLAAKGRSIPIPLAAKICADVLDGLGYAHDARGPDGAPLELVHRDISPQNILVSVDGVVKLVDFGIARAETILGRTQGVRIKGKFSYMAPEQWEPGRAIDARADLFALGVCLYEMSTGSGRLFKGSAAPELYKAVVIDEILPPSSRVPEYPAALSAVLMRALERRVSERWGSAHAMRAAMLEAMAASSWNPGADALSRLVHFALDGRSIEERWERIASGALPSPGEELPTVVTDSDAAPIPLRPLSLQPKELETKQEYALDVAHLASGGAVAQQADDAYALGSIAPSAPSSAPPPRNVEAPAPSAGRRTELGVVALAGWLTAGAMTGLWRRETNRVEVLTARVNTTALVPSNTPISLEFLADPSVVGVATDWSAALRSGHGTAARVTAGDALPRLLAGAAPLALRVGDADPASVAAAHTQGFDLRSAASEHLAGWDHGVVIVHASNPTASMSLAQLATVFSGVGSLNAVVTGRGTAPRAILDDMVLGPARAALSPRASLAANEAAAVAQVAADPNGIAVVRLIDLAPGVRAVALAPPRGAPVPATRDAIRANSYPLARPLRIYTRGLPIGAARAVVEVALSAEGQSMLERAGFIAR
ncbi:MAG: serine/threonine-protein kinase [Polyangiales bacterium]